MRKIFRFLRRFWRRPRFLNDLLFSLNDRAQEPTLGIILGGVVGLALIALSFVVLPHWLDGWTRRTVLIVWLRLFILYGLVRLAAWGMGQVLYHFRVWREEREPESD